MTLRERLQTSATNTKVSFHSLCSETESTHSLSVPLQPNESDACVVLSTDSADKKKT